MRSQRGSKVVHRRVLADNERMIRTKTLISSRFCSTLVALAIGAFALSPACAQNPADADVVAAKAAFDKGDAARLASIAPKVQGHVLAPYVRLWQLELEPHTRCLRRA